jgi:LysR family transcriptional regulator, glycine cleavage system transcriptional activator
MAAGKRAGGKARSLTSRTPRRLPLASLRVFVATAEHLSFSRAANTLGVSIGAVSMQVRALEEYLSAPLFRRRGRVVQLTGEGERLLPKVRSSLEALERAVDEARVDGRTGPLMVSMLASFLQQWLLPRLPDFNEKHPDIDLRLHTASSLVDFLRSEVQVAIRFGTGQWPLLHAEKLLDEWLVPVCSPRLFAKHGPVATQADLKKYRLLNSTSEPWRAWLEGPTMDIEWAPSGATFDDSVSLIRAAEAGQGLVLARWSLAENEIATGKLVVASKKIVPTDRGYYFVCPKTYCSLPKVEAFRLWISKQTREAPRPKGLAASVSASAASRA